MLLARLGLRASEVAQLKFVDIDWRNGSITVCGKGTTPRVTAVTAGGRQRDSALSESGQAIVAGARGIHFSLGPDSSVDSCGCHPHRAKRIAPGGDQSANQRCSRPAAFRRHCHAPSRCIPGWQSARSCDTALP